MFFFFKQKTAYEVLRSLVGSEMCIRDRADGVEEDFFVAGLGEIAGGAGLDAADGVLVFGVHAEDEDGEGRPFGLEVLEDFDAAHAGHGEVEEDDVDGGKAEAGEDVGAGGGGGDDLDVAFGRKNPGEAFANDGVCLLYTSPSPRDS